MMWLKLDEKGEPSVEGKTKPFCYHIDQFSELQPIIHKVIEYGQRLGLDMIQGDHEDAPARSSSTSASTAPSRPPTTSRPSARSASRSGRELDAFPTCRSRSWASRRTAATTTSPSGAATRTPSCRTRTRPSKPASGPPCGIMAHQPALTAVTASTVNSYRRLWDTGFWAPVFADWGYQNRTTALRVSAPGRFEYRSVDSAVNPYLSLAALIAAMRDGIDRKLDPGEPEERNIYEAMEAGKQVKKIPMTFGAALDAPRGDDVIKSALPGDMYRVFMHYKRDEWERHCAHVSDWDVTEYLDVLP